MQDLIAIFADDNGKMTMPEIQCLCPDISCSTITKALNTLINKGAVLKNRSGRYSAYVYNHGH